MVADHQEARLRHSRGHERGGLEEVVDPLERDKAREHGDDGRARRQAQLAPEPAVPPAGPKRGQVNAVADDHDLRRIVSLCDETPTQGLRVHRDPVGQAADNLLRPMLQCGQVSTVVPDRRHDRRDARQPGRRNSEEVTVKGVRVHDVDPRPPEVSSQPKPFPPRTGAVQPRDPVLGDRDPALGDLTEQLAPTNETAEAELEARGV